MESLKNEKLYPILKLRGVTKSFMGLTAINKLDLNLNKHEILGLIGPNGAGKTTLFNLLTGFCTPDKGTIVFKDKNTVGLRPFEICKLGITRTFQIVRPFTTLSVLENVMIGSFNRLDSRSKAEKNAMNILAFLDLSKKKEQKAGTLTRSDRKRLELARALATDAEIILLDEIMAGLNERETEEIIKIVRKISENGTTLLIIEHVMKAIMNLSDRIVVLNYGVKIADNAPKDISSDKKVIQAYLGEEYSGV